MDQPFREISAVDSVQRIFLLSEEGEILFESDAGWLIAEDRFVRMMRALAGLPFAEQSVFIYENGSLDIIKIELGYLLVSRRGSSFDMQVAKACAEAIAKLTLPEARKQMLLHLLAHSPSVVKPQIVKALIPYVDDQVARELVRLLQAEGTFAPEVRNRLSLHICQALKQHPFAYVLDALQEFLHGAAGVQDNVLAAAREAVQQIRTKLPEEARAAVSREPVLPASLNTGGAEVGKENDSPITDLPEERRVREYLAGGEKRKGVQLLKDMIKAVAQKRRFGEAEKLRQWLIRIDPAALSDIIVAAEIIEQEKAAAISREHLEVWASLQRALDSEPYSTLYHALEHKQYAKGEIVVRQGARQSSLYFVNSGNVELFFDEKGKEIKIKTIGPGEILGSGTFFEASVWTLTARSLGAELSRLTRDTMLQWQLEYPALEGKLMDYCFRFTIPVEAFAKQGRDRREHERYRREGRVVMNLLDKDEQETGIGAKGDLFDISAGGAAFSLRIAKKNNARLLLGRRVRLVFSLPTLKDLIVFAKVIAVLSQPVVGNEYSVHVSFLHLLTEEDMRSVVRW